MMTNSAYRRKPYHKSRTTPRFVPDPDNAVFESKRLNRWHWKYHWTLPWKGKSLYCTGTAWAITGLFIFRVKMVFEPMDGHVQSHTTTLPSWHARPFLLQEAARNCSGQSGGN